MSVLAVNTPEYCRNSDAGTDEPSTVVIGWVVARESCAA